MRSSIITHFAAAALFCLIVLLIYATVQQTYRTAANDPQLQLARDIANDIKNHQPYQHLADSPVDLKRSLDVFMQLYDQRGRLLSSGGIIGVQPPKIPAGVLLNAKQNMENTVTWQPQKDVRLAAVAAYTGNTDQAFVVVARSLQETENREANLRKIVLLFGAIGCCIIAVHWLVQTKLSK